MSGAMSALEQSVRKAIALHQAGELDAAQIAYEAILRQHPRDPNVLMNLSTLLLRRDQRDEAGKLLKKLMNFHPTLAYPYFCYGNVMMEQGRYAEAITYFERNLTRQPGHANAHWNIAMCYLLQGDYARGLPHFEWRWQSDHLKTKTRLFAEPLWLGQEEIAGKTLLVYPEQGFGDYLQSARFFAMLAARGAKLIIESPPALMALMQRSFPDLTFVATGEPLPPFDLQCPVMSLPLALGITLETMPSQVPYLAVPPDRLPRAEALLGPKTKPRIGLAWSGAATHLQDFKRSIPLAQLAPLLAQPFEFHSLQKELRPEDAGHLGAMPFHGDWIRDFADTAALIQQLDLVISVDTSIAHLAAALGKPVWLLLYEPPDYRWLLGRADTPLYPNMRLFRQPAPSDWPSAVQAVIEALNTTYRE